ncbi:MAG: hypothetical protein CVV24_00600 [Ignavibacteriae bacterium HGW-Ignavibacteriae-3]|nr:MAG: hypothetical protein CVV24_00600 [Ignavibacteriae bacterium HGW-Ignavibacteriae-3]
MKKENFILPLLVAGVIALIYFSYFGHGDELGLFSEFDTKSNANREIVVKLLPEKGIENDGSGEVSFYVEDRVGKQVLVSGSVSLPADFGSATRVELMGHYNGSSFHVHELKVKD